MSFIVSLSLWSDPTQLFNREESLLRSGTLFHFKFCIIIIIMQVHVYTELHLKILCSWRLVMPCAELLPLTVTLIAIGPACCLPESYVGIVNTTKSYNGEINVPYKNYSTEADALHIQKKSICPSIWNLSINLESQLQWHLLVWQ
jgi:hypothetical protein